MWISKRKYLLVCTYVCVRMYVCQHIHEHICIQEYMYDVGIYVYDIRDFSWSRAGQITENGGTLHIYTNHVYENMRMKFAYRTKSFLE